MLTNNAAIGTFPPSVVPLLYYIITYFATI